MDFWPVNKYMIRQFDYYLIKSLEKNLIEWAFKNCQWWLEKNKQFPENKVQIYTNAHMHTSMYTRPDDFMNSS